MSSSNSQIEYYSYPSDSNSNVTYLSKFFSDKEPFEPVAHYQGFFETMGDKRETLQLGCLVHLINDKEFSRRGFDLAKKAANETPYSPLPYVYIKELVSSDKSYIDEAYDFVKGVIAQRIDAYHVADLFYYLCANREGVDVIKDMKRLIEVKNKGFLPWRYMVQLCEEKGLIRELLDITEEYIKKDIFNNSAWSIRFTHFEAVSNVKSELSFVKEVLLDTPNNESAFNYIVSLVHKDNSILDEVDKLKNRLLDIYGEKLGPLRLMLFVASMMNDQEKIVYACEKISALDPIRVSYYNAVKSGKLKFV